MYLFVENLKNKRRGKIEAEKVVELVGLTEMKKFDTGSYSLLNRYAILAGDKLTRVVVFAFAETVEELAKIVENTTFRTPSRFSFGPLEESAHLFKMSQEKDSAVKNRVAASRSKAMSLKDTEREILKKSVKARADGSKQKPKRKREPVTAAAKKLRKSEESNLHQAILQKAAQTRNPVQKRKAAQGKDGDKPDVFLSDVNLDKGMEIEDKTEDKTEGDIESEVKSMDSDESDSSAEENVKINTEDDNHAEKDNEEECDDKKDSKEEDLEENDDLENIKDVEDKKEEDSKEGDDGKHEAKDIIDPKVQLHSCDNKACTSQLNFLSHQLNVFMKMLEKKEEESDEKLDNLVKDVAAIRESLEKGAKGPAGPRICKLSQLKDVYPETLPPDTIIPDDSVHIGHGQMIGKREIGLVETNNSGLRPRLWGLAKLFWPDNVHDWSCKPTSDGNLVTTAHVDCMRQILEAMSWNKSKDLSHANVKRALGKALSENKN